jgi:TetR/AcrR family transcriptional regulator
MMDSRQDRRGAEPTRHRILKAAIRVFSEQGLAGARIGAIATAARVNKALLYYYFRDKEALYAAALEDVAGKAAESALAVLDLDCSPGERMLRFALQHFDRILCQQGFQALMQQEMIRFREGRSGALRIIAKRAFEPMMLRARIIAQEGIRTGELCDVDWMQIMYAALGANVFYFLSAPMVRLVAPGDPMDPAAIAARRRAAIEFLGHAIFVDRKHGARLAKRVLSAMPIPKGAPREKRTA